MDSKPDPIDVHVGQKVRFRRVTVGLTQTELGKALGVTFQQIQKYEHGANRIGSSRLYKISQVLSTPVSFFFDGISEEIAENIIDEAKETEATADSANMVKKETLNLIRNYYGIKNASVRKHLYNLVKSMNKE